MTDSLLAESNPLVSDPAVPDTLLVLLIRARNGDETAYGALYDSVAPRLYRLAYNILLHREDAEDVTQEALIYAFRNLEHYDPARGSVRTWLFTIAISRCRNARRRKWLPTSTLSHLLSLGIEPVAPADQAPEAAAARMEVHHALEQALTTLSPNLREAVALRYGQGLMFREMAEVLGCPQKTAESRIRLAHDALRVALRAQNAELLLEEMWSF